jgi:hypothetical protein
MPCFLSSNHTKKASINHIPQAASQLVPIAIQTKIALSEWAIWYEWLNIMQESTGFCGSKWH